jgi:ribosomal protein S12 methylthiotransferase
MLKLMNRHGDGKTVREVVAKLRREIPDLTLRTTFIVGFPGERQEDFDELCEFVKEARFDHMGAFPYSREEGTPAYSLPDQIDEQIKQDRLDVLMRMQMHINEQQNEQKVGKTVRVLVEDFDAVSEAHFGRSEADAPDIDGKVYFGSTRRIAPGSFVDVRVDEVVDYDVYGTAVLPE